MDHPGHPNTLLSGVVGRIDSDGRPDASGPPCYDPLDSVGLCLDVAGLDHV